MDNLAILEKLYKYKELEREIEESGIRVLRVIKDLQVVAVLGEVNI